jgi:hypothetical protein
MIGHFAEPETHVAADASVRDTSLSRGLFPPARGNRRALLELLGGEKLVGRGGRCGPDRRDDLARGLLSLRKLLEREREQRAVEGDEHAVGHDIIPLPVRIVQRPPAPPAVTGSDGAPACFSHTGARRVNMGVLSPAVTAPSNLVRIERHSLIHAAGVYAFPLKPPPRHLGGQVFAR